MQYQQREFPYEPSLIESHVIRAKEGVSSVQMSHPILNKLVQCIDCTSLTGEETKEEILALCNKVMTLPTSLSYVGGLCIHIPHLDTAKKVLGSTQTALTTVVNFPEGRDDIEVVKSDTEAALNNGANEIDLVMNYHKYLDGKYDEVFSDIMSIKLICQGKAKLKVILETSEFSNLSDIYQASWLAMEAGADFVKSSTGKTSEGATLEKTAAMLFAIRDFAKERDLVIGVKPSGGIRTFNEVLPYVLLASELMGNDYCTPSHFRIGASSLLDDLIQWSKKI